MLLNNLPGAAAVASAHKIVVTTDDGDKTITAEQLRAWVENEAANPYNYGKEIAMTWDEIRNKKKKRSYFSPEKEEVPESSENINPQAVRRIREYVELNYGKSYLSESEQARVNRKFCTGIHKNCILYLTDGIL